MAASGALVLPPLLFVVTMWVVLGHVLGEPAATINMRAQDIRAADMPSAKTALCIAVGTVALMLRHRSRFMAIACALALVAIINADMALMVSSSPVGLDQALSSETWPWAAISLPVAGFSAMWMASAALCVLVIWPAQPLAIALSLAGAGIGIVLLLINRLFDLILPAQAGMLRDPTSTTALLILCLCIAIAITAVRSVPLTGLRRIDHYLAWSTLGLAALVWTAWQQLEHAEWQQRRFETALAHDSLTSGLSVQLSERGTSQLRLANRWAIYGVPTQEQWLQDAKAVLDDFPGIFAIAYVGVDRIVRWRVARDGNNEGFVGRDLNADENRRAAFTAAAQLNSTQATPSIQLVSGARGNVFITPIFYDKELQGYIVSSITAEDLIGLMQQTAHSGFHASILDAGGRVAGQSPVVTDPGYDLRMLGTRNLLGQNWTVKVWPSEDYLVQRHSKLPGTILGVGMICVLLVGAALTQSRAALLHRTNAEDLAQRIARTLETINEGFVTLSPSWEVTYVNRRAIDILGWQGDTAAGRNITESSPQFEGSELHGVLQDVLASGGTARTTILRPNGKQWLEVTAHAVPEGVAMYLRDVTEARARDAQLRLLETAVSRQNDTLIITDVATDNEKDSPRIQYVNDAFTRMTGYSADEVIGKTLHFLQGPKTCRHELDRVNEALHSRMPIRVELINYSKDGREYWVEIDIASFADASGVVTHHVAVERDITERKRAEEASAIMDERFQQVVMATNDVIWDIDLQTRAVWYNEAGRAMFFVSPDGGTFTVDDWANLTHPDDRDRVVRKAEQALAGTVTDLIDDYRLRKWDGSYAHVVSRGRIIRDADGKPVRLVGALIDETERRELDRRLRIAQRLEAVGQLTGGIAHDFNNLLTVILGNAELLSERLTDQPVLKQMADVTLRAASSGAELTERLLAFARRKPLIARGMDINALVLGMKSLLARTLPERITVDIAPSDDAWNIVADASQLESAILNLTLNARDAMPQGGTILIGTANITVTDADAAQNIDAVPGDYVEISVTDNGTGMTPEVLSRALEPFFTTKEMGKGTGLGLSMVYGFARQSGGFLRIQTQSGKGTTMGLCLPRGQGTAAPADVPDLPAEPSQTAHEHILLVDDEPLVRENVANMMLRLGYKVSMAASGTEALALLASDPTVDLLFTDVVMPGDMDGRDLAQAALREHPGLRVLFASGHSNVAPGPDGHILPGIPLLGKPFHLRDLSTALRRAFNRT
jgi:PAS domain S-box-containing protein